jgi:hypothetical protein
MAEKNQLKQTQHCFSIRLSPLQFKFTSSSTQEIPPLRSGGFIVTEVLIETTPSTVNSQLSIAN